MKTLIAAAAGVLALGFAAAQAAPNSYAAHDGYAPHTAMTGAAYAGAMADATPAPDQAIRSNPQLQIGSQARQHTIPGFNANVGLMGGGG